MFVYDGKQLQIVGCEKILELNDSKIHVVCQNKEYIIIGTSLKVLELNQKTLWIHGIVASIGIQYV